MDATASFFIYHNIDNPIGKAHINLFESWFNHTINDNKIKCA